MVPNCGFTLSELVVLSGETTPRDFWVSANLTSSVVFESELIDGICKR